MIRIQTNSGETYVTIGHHRGVFLESMPKQEAKQRVLRALGNCRREIGMVQRGNEILSVTIRVADPDLTAERVQSIERELLRREQQ